MSDIRADVRATVESVDGTPLSPPEMASRVAVLADGSKATRGGRLPMWNRIEASPSRANWSRLNVAAAWCLTLAMLLIAALRVVCHDATVPLVWLNAFTLYIYLPAYVVLAYAAWQRCWWLATASAAVVACHVAWVGPDFRPATPYLPPSASATEKPQSVRVFYANVLGQNLEINPMIDEAIGSNADVIVLAEMQRPWYPELAKSEALKEYRYGTQLQHRHEGDVNVFSRLPIRRLQLIKLGNRTSVVADLALENETLRLFCLHSPRPIVDGAGEYVLFWRQMEPILAEQLEPIVVVGDFNATQHSLVYEQLMSGHFRSAHEDRGRGYATTWPNGLRPVPPIRIDQAFLSPQVECISVDEGTGLGSDHKPLILDVRVHEPGPAGAAR
jgi:endonuclease/exonuclease/phosphatase (EEP) superfamily protein YafD